MAEKPLANRWFTPSMVLIGAAALGVVSTAEQTPTDTAPVAVAELKSPEGDRIGRAELRDTPSGVLVRLALENAPTGVHAFHLHETGRCDAPSFESAGGHFNPSTAEHGFENAKGPHAGDLPNVHIPASGTLEIEVLAHAALRGTAGLLDGDGSAIVLHGGADDYSTDPAGGAGPRVACGVLTPGIDR